MATKEISRRELLTAGAAASGFTLLSSNVLGWGRAIGPSDNVEALEARASFLDRHLSWQSQKPLGGEQ